jgi:hypothetical protein
MAISLTFHVPTEANPSSILSLIKLMARKNLTFHSVKQLLQFTNDQGIGSRTEIQILATSCGLLEKTKGKIRLSKVGQAVAELSSNVQPDVVHYLLYSSWTEDHPTVKTRLWSYRRVCDMFWDRSPVDIMDFLDPLVEGIHNRISSEFDNLQDHELGAASFSRKSVRGVRKWLEALIPPCIEGNTFLKRHFCTPELMLLALGWVGKQADEEVGIDLLLTPERREALCRICLLDATALDRSLDYMLPIYPDVIREGTKAGVYGRFVHLVKWPEITDLL